MSCLRSADALSICSSSAKLRSSAGVLRLSSWRFIGGFGYARGGGQKSGGDRRALGATRLPARDTGREDAVFSSDRRLLVLRGSSKRRRETHQRRDGVRLNQILSPSQTASRGNFQ